MTPIINLHNQQEHNVGHQHCFSCTKSESSYIFRRGCLLSQTAQTLHTFVAIGIPSSVIKPPMLLALTVLLDRVRPSGATPRST